MSAMQPAPQQKPSRASNAVLALLLVLGNLFFWGCVASRTTGIPTAWSDTAGETVRIVLAEG